VGRESGVETPVGSEHETQDTGHTAEGNRLRIKVSDTGPGIAAEDLEKLFTPFERLGAENTNVEGTGIGLAVSQRLVELMGGDIGVESELGQGSTFWMELPLTHSIESKMPGTELDAELNESNPARPPALDDEHPACTVLYIEDNLANLRLIERILLQQSQIKLLAAMQGIIGLELARQHHLDLILLDLNLPDMGGQEVLRQLREDPATRETPVVIISADATPGQIERLLAAGANAYLTKPLDPFDLQTRLLAAARVTALHTDLADTRAELSRQANTDALTGLRNRHAMSDDLAQLHAASVRQQDTYCLAMCDLDFFKSYNDTYGHPAGDRALIYVATTLTTHLRQADRIYRYGGEEFLILLPQQNLHNAATALQRVRTQLRTAATDHSGAETGAQVTLSIGLAASTPTHRPDQSTLLANADRALYHAKRAGRDQIVTEQHIHVA